MEKVYDLRAKFIINLALLGVVWLTNGTLNLKYSDCMQLQPDSSLFKFLSCNSVIPKISCLRNSFIDLRPSVPERPGECKKYCH